MSKLWHSSLMHMHVQEPKGLPYVFHSFPERFRKQFKGKGHEVCTQRRRVSTEEARLLHSRV